MSSGWSQSSSEESDPSEGTVPSTPEGIRQGFVDFLATLRLPSYGGVRDETEAGRFLMRLEDCVRYYQCTPQEAEVMAEFCLSGDASVWWNDIKDLTRQVLQGDVWARFRRAFTVEYSPRLVGRTRPRVIYPVSPDHPEPTEDGPKREISGTVRINGHEARAVFDSGATHTYIDKNFVRDKGLITTSLSVPRVTICADGRTTVNELMCEDCRLMVGEMATTATMVVMPLGSCDALIGMDWMGAYYAHLDCRREEVVFNIPGRSPYTFRG